MSFSSLAFGKVLGFSPVFLGFAMQSLALGFMGLGRFDAFASCGVGLGWVLDLL